MLVDQRKNEKSKKAANGYDTYWHEVLQLVHANPYIKYWGQLAKINKSKMAADQHDSHVILIGVHANLNKKHWFDRTHESKALVKQTHA